MDADFKRRHFADEIVCGSPRRDFVRLIGLEVGSVIAGDRVLEMENVRCPLLDGGSDFVVETVDFDRRFSTNSTPAALVLSDIYLILC